MINIEKRAMINAFRPAIRKFVCKKGHNARTREFSPDNFCLINMPLLLLTGFPCSGKTTIAGRVVKEFEDKGIHPILIDDSFNSEYNRSAEFYLTKRKVVL